MSSWPRLFKIVITGDFNRRSIDKYLYQIPYKSTQFSSVLHFAVIGGNIEVIKYLICNGADVNARNQYCETPLHWCCKEGSLKLAQTLIENGADASCSDFDGNTPLHWAAEYNQHEIVSYLLTQNVPFDERNVSL